jgi:hypothetical protein
MVLCQKNSRALKTSTQITPIFFSYKESILKIKFIPGFFGHCYVSQIFLNDMNF